MHSPLRGLNLLWLCCALAVLETRTRTACHGRGGQMRGARGAVAVIVATTCALTMTAAPALAGGDKWGGGHGGRDQFTVIARGLNIPGCSLQRVPDPRCWSRRRHRPDQSGQPALRKCHSGCDGRSHGRQGRSRSVARSRSSPATTARRRGKNERPPASLLVAKSNRTPSQLADLMAYELKKNPDGQTQFDPDGVPLRRSVQSVLSSGRPWQRVRDRRRRGWK